MLFFLVQICRSDDESAGRHCVLQHSSSGQPFLLSEWSRPWLSLRFQGDLRLQLRAAEVQLHHSC